MATTLSSKDIKALRLVWSPAEARKVAKSIDPAFRGTYEAALWKLTQHAASLPDYYGDLARAYGVHFILPTVKIADRGWGIEEFRSEGCYPGHYCLYILNWEMKDLHAMQPPRRRSKRIASRSFH
jgi:hypothetical protein